MVLYLHLKLESCILKNEWKHHASGLKFTFLWTQGNSDPSSTVDWMGGKEGQDLFSLAPPFLTETACSSLPLCTVMCGKLMGSLQVPVPVGRWQRVWGVRHWPLEGSKNAEPNMGFSPEPFQVACPLPGTEFRLQTNKLVLILQDEHEVHFLLDRLLSTGQEPFPLIKSSRSSWDTLQVQAQLWIHKTASRTATIPSCTGMFDGLHLPRRCLSHELQSWDWILGREQIAADRCFFQTAYVTLRPGSGVLHHYLILSPFSFADPRQQLLKLHLPSIHSADVMWGPLGSEIKLLSSLPGIHYMQARARLGVFILDLLNVIIGAREGSLSRVLFLPERMLAESDGGMVGAGVCLGWAGSSSLPHSAAEPWLVAFMASILLSKQGCISFPGFWQGSVSPRVHGNCLKILRDVIQQEQHSGGFILSRSWVSKGKFVPIHFVSNGSCYSDPSFLPCKRSFCCTRARMLVLVLE